VQAYAYKALSAASERSQGTIAASNRREALERLLSQGWHVLELHEVQAPGPSSPALRLFRRPRLRLATLTRELATLCGSGVPLVRSMEVLIRQADGARARKVLEDILESVKAGSTLGDALAEHSEVFPEIMISMVRMGELGGTLDDVLARLSEMFEKQEEIRAEVRAALAYPCLVLLLGMGSALVLLKFVIPRLLVMFEGIGERLPLPTRILCGVSDVLSAYWWAMLLGAGAAAIGVGFAARRPGFRLAWDGLKLRIPWVGKLVRQSAIARFARSLGTLVHADVSIVEALRATQAAAGNAVISAAIRDMATKVQAGVSLADLMKSAAVFPPMPVEMVSVGEETGRLDQMLLRVAEAHERQSAASVRMMTSLLAPLLIICVAVVVAFIILSLVLPIFQLSAGIG